MKMGSKYHMRSWRRTNRPLLLNEFASLTKLSVSEQKTNITFYLNLADVLSLSLFGLYEEEEEKALFVFYFLLLAVQLRSNYKSNFVFQTSNDDEPSN